MTTALSTSPVVPSAPRTRVVPITWHGTDDGPVPVRHESNIKRSIVRRNVPALAPAVPSPFVAHAGRHLHIRSPRPCHTDRAWADQLSHAAA